MAKRSIYDRNWIIENALEVVKGFDYGVLTLRGLHYKLVSRGMTNDDKHYHKIKSAMTKARQDGLIAYEQFSDFERAMLGKTPYEIKDLNEDIEEAKTQIGLWMKNYYLNKWSNQDSYLEVFVEKKALQGVLLPVCKQERVALGACKGYPSLTFLNDAAKRFRAAENQGKRPIIVYLGD